jgi:hypothetical protein
MKNADDRIPSAPGNGDTNAAAGPSAPRFPFEQLDAPQQRTLAELGVAVLDLWSDLPSDTRQQFVSRLAMPADPDVPALQARITRFVANATTLRARLATPLRPGVSRAGRDDEDFVDRAKLAYKLDGGVSEPAHYSHINEFEGKRVVVLRNKRGVLAVYEDVGGLATRLAHWPVSWV